MDSLSSKVLNKIFTEWPVLETLNVNKINDLVSGLVQMQKFGVNSFAIRTIDKTGQSAMFCTNVSWPLLIQNEDFMKDFKKHISSELVYSYKNKVSIISRSGDKTYSSFLHKLQQAGQNNSIIVNDFYKDKVEITYFMATPEFPQDRDIILNNLQQLNFIKDNLSLVLKEIFKSKEFQLRKQPLLNDSAINIIWDKGIKEQKIVNLFLHNKEIVLTVRELECLSLLIFGASNTFISSTLGISIETVKRHLLNAKSKLGVSSRQELIEVSRNEQFRNVFKIIRTV